MHRRAQNVVGDSVVGLSLTCMNVVWRASGSASAARLIRACTVQCQLLLIVRSSMSVDMQVQCQQWIRAMLGL